jgi:hypothetical protein
MNVIINTITPSHHQHIASSYHHSMLTSPEPIVRQKNDINDDQSGQAGIPPRWEWSEKWKTETQLR